MIRFLKEFTKRMTTRWLNVHRPSSGKDILILASPRSGSTWLMEMFYSEPGMKFINEPLGKRILDYWDLLPIETRWNYIDLTEREKEVLKAYFNGDSSIRHFGPRNIFHEDFNLFTDRRVIKLIRANALVDWFRREFPFQIVYLLRHPISQAQSCIQRGHHHQIEDFLESPRYRERLSSEAFNFASEMCESDDSLAKFVTEWALENLFPIGRWRNDQDILLVSYEELVLRYELYVDLFMDRLELSCREAMLAQENSPSRTTDSSSQETRQNIRERDKAELMHGWEGSLSSDRERNLMSILERFNLNVYSPGQALPRDPYLTFPEDGSTEPCERGDERVKE